MSESSKQRSEPQNKIVFRGEATVWTDQMLTALGNGVKGGKWHSLMDKVYAPKTLVLAWKKVRANKGGAGVDNITIDKFESNALRYLQELHEALKHEHCKLGYTFVRGRRFARWKAMKDIRVKSVNIHDGNRVKVSRQ